MNPPHPAALGEAELRAQCDTVRTRRSGPGGQHRNKVETAVVLTHRGTGVQGEAAERRSQAENLRQAVFRLRVNLALQVRCSWAPPPSELWRRRCLRGRVLVNEEHEDYPALLAEALDALQAAAWNPAAASEGLDCTTSQLIKLLKKSPRALPLVNQRRGAAGLGPLK